MLANILCPYLGTYRYKDETLPHLDSIVNTLFQKLAGQRSVHPTFCAKDIQVIQNFKLDSLKIASLPQIGKVETLFLEETLDVKKNLEAIFERTSAWKPCTTSFPNKNKLVFYLIGKFSGNKGNDDGQL